MRPFPFTLDDPRTQLLNAEGERCCPRWFEVDQTDGRVVNKRWVLTPLGWEEREAPLLA